MTSPIIPEKLSEKDFVAWNEEMAKKYDPDSYHHNPNPFIRWIEGRRTKAILKFIQARKQDSILEVGVGAGNILAQVPRGKLFGVDISEFLLEKAKRRLPNSREQLVLGNAEELSRYYLPGSFDVVYCSEVLEHVQNPSRVIDEIIKVAKPGARIIISIPNERLINSLKSALSLFGLLGRWFPGVAKKMDDEWHVHAFDERMFLDLTKSKLQISKRASIPFFFLPIRRVYLCRI